MTEKSVVLEDQWYIDEFGGVELNDARLNRRCAALAGQLATQPEGPINQACEDWAESKGRRIAFR